MKIPIKIFILLLSSHTVFAAEGQDSAGLPQMDITTFPSQLFWLVITFAILYIFMWRVVIPKLSTTIEERKDKISNDINEAEKFNSEATSILEKYEEQISSASQSASDIISESKSQMNEYFENLKLENEKKIAEMIRNSQEMIKLREKDSINEVRNATLETVKEITIKYLDKIPNDDQILKKLN
tara:strand:- start:736 stop:1287 length:552 start_codon:yes stop_codon:yes gene_type:complete